LDGLYNAMPHLSDSRDCQEQHLASASASTNPALLRSTPPPSPSPTFSPFPPRPLPPLPYHLGAIRIPPFGVHVGRIHPRCLLHPLLHPYHTISTSVAIFTTASSLHQLHLLLPHQPFSQLVPRMTAPNHQPSSPTRDNQATYAHHRRRSAN
jgi:hypothetical protein